MTAKPFNQEEHTMDNYHLSPTSEGWELKEAGAECASKRASTKHELVSAIADFFDGKTA
jgi:hypothetical protein